MEQSLKLVASASCLLLAVVSGSAPAAGPPATSPPPSTQGAINTSRSNLKNTSRFAAPAAAQDRRIVTPIEIRFENGADYDDFAAGRLPLSLTLRNAASGQTIRFDPLIIDLGASRDRSKVRFDVRIDAVEAPLLSGGCFETVTEARPTAAGLAIILTYAPCNPQAPSTHEVATPIKGIGVVVKKNKPPYGNARLIVTTGASAVGAGADTQVTARYGGAQFGGTPVLSSRGVASPRPEGF